MIVIRAGSGFTCSRPFSYQETLPGQESLQPRQSADSRRIQRGNRIRKSMPQVQIIFAHVSALFKSRPRYPVCHRFCHRMRHLPLLPPDACRPKHLRPTVTSMYCYVQPVVASFVVAVCGGLSSFNPTKIIAILLVFTGVFLVTRSKSRAQMEASQEVVAK